MVWGCMTRGKTPAMLRMGVEAVVVAAPVAVTVPIRETLTKRAR